MSISVIKPITAQEARAIMEESEFLLKSTYRWIKDSATRNCNSLELENYEYDPEIFKNTLSILKADGYKVQKCCDDSEVERYIISW